MSLPFFSFRGPGSRGAKVAAQTLAPDMAVVIDTVPASDPITPRQQARQNAERGRSFALWARTPSDGERSTRRKFDRN